MSVFRFKKFEVRNEASAMKVGTDTVLLGVGVDLTPFIDTRESSLRILDAGTGTGTVALILAQRLENSGIPYHIKGIDIDAPSAAEASRNFSASPWADTMSVENIPLQKCGGTFDLIVSNPPFFDSSLQAPSARRNMARHTASADEEGMAEAAMSYRTLLEFAKNHLSEEGEIAMILPADLEAAVVRYGKMCGFSPRRILRIKTVLRKKPARMVIEFARKRTDTVLDELVMQDSAEWTGEYRSLVKDFYLWA